MWCSTSRIVRSKSLRIVRITSRELADLLVVQPAGRLVEQQEARLRDERARELDALQRPERQAAGEPVGDVGELDVVERLAAPDGGRGARENGRMRVCAPTSRFSSTVMFWKRTTFWNVRAIPSRTMRCGGVRVRSLPSNTMRPSFGL